jgi:acetyltransferase-like isoleucine patch superfamily enzyme
MRHRKKTYLESLLVKYGSYKTHIKLARKWGVEIGERCIVMNCDFGTEPYLVTIGNHCLIGPGVQFVTHDAGIWVFKEDHTTPTTKFGPIIVHDNCVIGIRSIIMPDVEIGPNSVVGAGSVVARDVPPNTVYAGNPVKYVESYDEYLEKSRLKDTGPIENGRTKEQQLIQRFKNK